MREETKGTEERESKEKGMKLEKEKGKGRVGREG